MSPIARVGIIAYMSALPLTAQLFEENSNLGVPLTQKQKAVRTWKLQPRLLSEACLVQVITN